MRLANLEDRLVLLTDDGAVDVARASGGTFASDPQAIYERWQEFQDWATGADLAHAEPLYGRSFGPPVPRPRQVFAIGLNYSAPTAESVLARPREPPVFTKVPASITSPNAEVALPTDTVDWEAELVAVIG